MTEVNSQSELVGALAKIMAEVGSVEKRGRNDFHRYDYATAADVMHKLQPLMAEHGIIIFQTEKSRELVANELAMAVAYEFTIAHSSGAVWPDRPVQTGVAAAKTSKGTFDDKCINKCHTAARKYFLLALFQIPTGDYEEADADGDVPTNGRSHRPDTGGVCQIRGDDNGSTPIAYMSHFRTQMRSCETEPELRKLWAEHKEKRRLNGLTQEQVSELIGELQVAVADVSVVQREAAE